MTMSHRATYSTADLRKNLAEALSRTHQRKDEIIDVMNHGKHHASLVSDESAEFLRLIFQKLDKKSLSELKQIMHTIPEGAKVNLTDLSGIINKFEHYLATSWNSYTTDKSKKQTERKQNRAVS
jgi:hypothetical protein